MIIKSNAHELRHHKKMKLFSVFAFVAVASALDYDSIGLKKPNKNQAAAAPVDKVKQHWNKSQKTS